MIQVLFYAKEISFTTKRKTPGRVHSYFETVVGKNVHGTIPKGNMGYEQFPVLDTVAVEPSFDAFL